MGEWQTIDSAPLDGSFILLFGKQIKHDLINHGGQFIFSGYWEEIDEGWCAMGSTWTGPFFVATHWQPLPAPPVST